MEMRIDGSGEIENVKNYSQLERLYPGKRRMRSVARDGAIFWLSLFSKIDLSGEWIRFVCYHHIFDDERAGFDRQLKFLKKYGDYISIDDAVDIFEKRHGVGGRYFCMTFDDGFRNCLTNALPILAQNNCRAAFFIATDYIGCDIERDRHVTEKFFSTSRDAYPLPVEFLNWEDCKALLDAGMSIGSHSCGHVPPAGLDDLHLRTELAASKEKIEKELGVRCDHFCCPWGKSGVHFRPTDDAKIVKDMGYRSFLTAERGANLTGTDPYAIRRDHLIAGWGDYQLRYFFSR